MLKNMDLKFSKIVCRDQKRAEMFMYGALGEDAGEINGHYFAQELNWLGRNYDEVRIRINCDGGLITHGLSIFSEMITSSARIIARVDGIAASMGAALLPAADKVEALDYARIMLHSPWFRDDDGKQVQNLSDKDKKAIAVMKDLLVSLLTKRGITDADAQRMLSNGDAWYTASEAVAAFLVDEVISTGKAQEFESLEPLKMVAKINTLNTLYSQKPDSMKNLIAKFNLPEASDEAAVLQAVSQLETAHQAALDKVTKERDQMVEKLIAVSKLGGVITDETEANFRKLATTDPELFTQLVNVKKEDLTAGNPTRLSELLAKLTEAAGQPTEPKDEKDWDWYQKNAPEALAQLRISEPDKYKAMKNAYEAKFV